MSMKAASVWFVAILFVVVIVHITTIETAHHQKIQIDTHFFDVYM